MHDADESATRHESRPKIGALSADSPLVAQPLRLGSLGIYCGLFDAVPSPLFTMLEAVEDLKRHMLVVYGCPSN